MRRLFAQRGRERAFSPPELKNPEREAFRFRRRLLIAGVLMLAAFGGLFARFVDLQVIQHGHYQTLADSNRVAIVPIAPNRASSPIATTSSWRRAIPPTRWRSCPRA